MFEASLFDSQKKTLPRRTRYTVAGSIAIQAVILAGALLFPLIHPATLPIVSAAPRAVSLNLRREPPKPKPVPVQTQPQSTSTTVSVPTQARVETNRGGNINHLPAIANIGDAPTLPVGGGNKMGSDPFGTGIASIGNGGSGPSVVAAKPTTPTHTGPIKISGGVTAGLLISPFHAVYPAIAKAAHQQGTVVLEAVIDKTGQITGLRIVSGPDMLRTAALEAVEPARYKPYLLNGLPTEVQTTITVVFRMDS